MYYVTVKWYIVITVFYIYLCPSLYSIYPWSMIGSPSLLCAIPMDKTFHHGSVCLVYSSGSTFNPNHVHGAKKDLTVIRGWFEQRVALFIALRTGVIPNDPSAGWYESRHPVHSPYFPLSITQLAPESHSVNNYA